MGLVDDVPDLDTVAEATDGIEDVVPVRCLELFVRSVLQPARDPRAMEPYERVPLHLDAIAGRPLQYLLDPREIALAFFRLRPRTVEWQCREVQGLAEKLGVLLTQLGVSEPVTATEKSSAFGRGRNL